jgi:F-type H+-transporting ATPase subunit alpha
MDRAPVSEPLQTGIKVIDALIPIGRGQRELILGDRQVGKTAIALDTIINQQDEDVVCVYCAIGQRDAAVARFVADLRRFDALAYSVVVVASGEHPPGMQFVAPYAATTMAEYFMEQGQDVLIVYDDLTRHARAYRELSLLLRRPPGREAYPGDIFYVHSRLLERATHLSKALGSGSLTALPIIETQAQNISAYVPTNLISITDGQIYLSPKLFQKGVLPAVDVGESVSRVGGKAQLPAYRAVAGDLRLAYSQFEELEVFSRFGTRLEEETHRQLERGRRVREVLKQARYEPMPVAEQIAVLLAVTEGLLDALPLDRIQGAEKDLRRSVRHRLPDLCQDLQTGAELDEQAQAKLLDLARDVLDIPSEAEDDTDA